MHRILGTLFLLLVVLIPASLATATPYDRDPWVGNQPDVLHSYFARPTAGSAQYAQIKYKPRAFTVNATTGDPTYPNDIVVDPGTYAGWGIMPTWNSGLQRQASRTDWFSVYFNRPATIGIVVRSGAPFADCVAGLTQSGTVKIQRGKTLFTYPVFNVEPTQTDAFLGYLRYDVCAVNTGTTVGAVSRDAPLLLIGEANATAPIAPTVPAAHTEEQPQPNQTCPLWLLNENVSTGPDGLTYPGYAYQIDPVYWCYNRQEHGTDPALFAPEYQIAYGYQAAKYSKDGMAMPMSEPYFGFKTIITDTVYNGHTYRWLIAPHIGTSAVGSVCQNIHSVNVALLDVEAYNAGTPYDQALLADIRLMIDFGPSVHNDTSVPIRPASCPNQYEQTKTANGVVKKFPVSTGTPGYEPWVGHLAKASQIAFNGVLLVNTADPKVWCDEAGDGVTTFCDMLPTGVKPGGNQVPAATGTSYFFQGSTFGFSYPTNTTKPTGHFCTDSMGITVISCDSPIAVAQYISPALVGKNIFTNANRMENVYSFGDRFYWDGAAPLGVNAPAAMREGSIRPYPLDPN